MTAIIISCLFLLASTSAMYINHFGGPKFGNYGIFGGTPVNITEAPYMALFRPKNIEWGCGASIVHEQYLVTAAHCVVMLPAETRITVGTDKVSGGEDYEIEKMVHHPNFSMQTADYDIAVIKLKKKLVLSNRVNLIKMADSTLVPKPGDNMITLGFGATEHQEMSKILLKVTIPFVDQKTCQEAYNKANAKITEHMTCAGGVQGKDSCGGDSGGPLIYEGKLMGTVSFGLGDCGTKGVPGVYSNLPSMRSFINNMIKNN